MDMEEQLAAIDKKQDRTCVLLEHLAEKVGERIDMEDRRHERVMRTLFGNNGTPGMHIEIDRLKQSHERQKWLSRTALSAIVILFFGALWSFVVA